MQREGHPLESAVQKLRQEQFLAMKTCARIAERKVMFILALFGLGGYGIVRYTDNTTNFTYLYYLIPLLAIGFDTLIERQTFSIDRIGVFLRNHSTDCLEREWEEFVHNDKLRWTFCPMWFHPTVDTFTIVTFLVCVWGVLQFRHDGHFSEVNYTEYGWFILLACFAVYIKVPPRIRIRTLGGVRGF
jgi:hypothetical protein